MVAQRREDLHRAVDQLPDDQVEPAIHLLRDLQAKGDPLIRLLREAPEDDEELTPEDEAGLREAEEAYKRGKWVSHEEVRRKLGL